jgi:hypothetical protein
MVFIIITVLAVTGLTFRFTYVRFLSGIPSDRRTGLASVWREYAGWFGDGLRGLFDGDFPGRAWTFTKSWLAVNYPGWRQWIFWALAASFGFCAATGFAFAVFTKRGMYGLPLLAHVMAGALFAVSLTAALLLRARAFRPDGDPGLETCDFCPLLKTLPKKLVLTVFFWGFAAAGLALIVTALASMLPYFYFRAQFPLLEFHRYGALAAVLAAAALFDFGMLPRRT